MGDRVALLRRIFDEEVQCPDCGGRLRLIALVKMEETSQALLSVLHLLTGPPKVLDRVPPDASQEEFEVVGEGESTDWPEFSGLREPLPYGGRAECALA
jgi:hypothetical protein